MNDADVSKQIQQMVRLVRQEADEKANDVSKQIQQMLRLIRQEADEKANEISVSAEEFCGRCVYINKSTHLTSSS